MKHTVRRRFAVGLSLPVLALALGLPVGPSAGRAQAPRSDSGVVRRLEVPEDVKTAMLKNSGELKRTFDELRSGKQPVTEAAKVVIDKMAMGYAYRLTWSEYWEGKVDQKLVSQLVKEVTDPAGRIVDDRPSPKLKPEQAKYQQEFGRRLLIHLGTVLHTPTRPIARVNAALILRRLGSTNLTGPALEDFTKLTIELIAAKDPNEPARVHALHAVHDQFAWRRPDVQNHFKDKDKEAETRLIRALTDYIGRKTALDPKADPQEVAAQGYLRRVAVQALGETRYPALGRRDDLNKKLLIEAPTALVLLKVLSKIDTVPEPTIGERFDAALGLCQLEYKRFTDYNADVAAYHLGHFLVELVDHYNREREEKKEPWQLMAVRLRLALEAFGKDTDPTIFKGYVRQMLAVAAPLARLMEEKSNEVRADPLDDWLKKNPPKNKTVYKDDPASALPLPGIEGAS